MFETRQRSKMSKGPRPQITRCRDLLDELRPRGVLFWVRDVLLPYGRNLAYEFGGCVLAFVVLHAHAGVSVW